MMTMACKALQVLALAVSLSVLASCATIPHEAAKGAYKQERDKEDVVLLSVNWGRKWGCAGFENAQLMSLGFDRGVSRSIVDQSPPDLVLASPGRLMVDPVYLPYALLLEPGEYVLSGFKIKAAQSTSDVGAFEAHRADLTRNGLPAGGSFTVAAGETLYIGHFFLACDYQPSLWRYYLEDRQAFNDYLVQVNKKYPFLDLRHVQFRLYDGPFGEYESMDHPFAVHEAAGQKADDAGDYKTAEQQYEQAPCAGAGRPRARPGHFKGHVQSGPRQGIRVQGQGGRGIVAEGAEA
jgi:hypothetical protein